MKTVHHTLRNAFLCSALYLNASMGSIAAPPVVAASADLPPKITGITFQTISPASITPTLNSLATSMNGTRWNERNGLGKQCYSCAYYVFNTVFNRGIG